MPSTETTSPLGAVQPLHLCPAPILVYKPRQDGAGSALRARYRTAAAVKETDMGLIPTGRAVSGSALYIDLAAQLGFDDKGNATFNWPNDDSLKQTAKALITAKLGSTDVRKLLLGYQWVRLLGKPTPESIRTIGKVEGKWVPEPKGITVGLVHKFNDATTFIEWKFAGSGSIVTVSKSKELRRSVALDLAEELGFHMYLEQALQAFQQTGVR